jgi:hypothetical protein
MSDKNTQNQETQDQEESSWNWKTVAKYGAAAAVAVGSVYFVYRKCRNQVTEV